MLFNSLGSNYDFSFVIKALFSFGKKEDEEELKNFLNKRYSGESTLLYKGREAIKLALEVLDLPKSSRVGITGFTCYAVYQAIIEAGYIPVYVDIEKDTLNFTLSELQKQKDLKVVIVQNTLGIPCDIEDISGYCKKNGIFLIEDLAHSVGVVYKEGQEAGTVGDFTALSFSQDKMLDAISAGALVIRNKKYQGITGQEKLTPLSLGNQLRDRFYPLLTFIVRKTYGLGLGKILHHLLKKAGFLSKSMPKGKINFHKLPNWYSLLVYRQFSKLEKELAHRKRIAEIYREELKEKFAGIMRFAIFVSDRSSLIGRLKRFGVFVSDTWYDAPIAPKKYLSSTNYKYGKCPMAEKAAKTILNLPTHIQVSAEAAKNISAIINTWQTTR